MKSIIVALAIILMAQASFGASPQYIELFPISQSQVTNDLRDLGADYVVQQGVFVNTKSPLPGAFYELTKTEKYAQKITSSATYYRFTVILTEKDNLAVVRATYVVRFNSFTGAFTIPSYHYKIIGGNPNGKPSVGGPSLVDVRPLNNGNGSLSDFFGASADFVVGDAKEKGQLPESFDRIAHIYNAYLVNSGYPPQYVFLITVANAEGDTFRVQITATEVDNNENPTVISSLELGPGAYLESQGGLEYEYEFEGMYFGKGFNGKNKIEYVIYPNS